MLTITPNILAIFEKLKNVLSDSVSMPRRTSPISLTSPTRQTLISFIGDVGIFQHGAVMLLHVFPVIVWIAICL